MRHRTALLGSSAGLYVSRNIPLIERLRSNQGLVRGDTITVPLSELEAAGGDLLACPSVQPAGGAAKPRE